MKHNKMSTFLRGATKKWLDILARDGMLERLLPVLEKVTARNYTPRDMFAFARYSLAAVKVVILVTEPEMHPDSFAASMHRVWLATGLVETPPTTWDLSHLAAQGIFLIPCALTVEVNKPGSHIKAWQAWMDTVIQRLSAELPSTTWCLWGDADRKRDLISARHTVWTAVHPLHPEFAQCDHFTKIAACHPGIVWDASHAETHFYTDGAAKNNQSRECRAAWGVACTRGLMAGRTWQGVTQTRTIVGPRPKTTKSTGETRKFRPLAGGLVEIEARPTNIRAEAEALIKALALASRLPVPFTSVIHTDSKFWMTDMLGVGRERGYMQDWRDRGSPWTSHANSDLCEALWSAWDRAQARCQLHFVNAWHDRARPLEAEDLEWWLGNQAAERAAESAL